MKVGSIYKILNTVTGKFYIGSAKNIRIRRNEHFYRLRYNRHGNSKLQRSFNKHGELNFVLEIVEVVKDEFLLSREQYFIDLLKPEYNICKIAGRVTGLVRTEEWKKKISQAHKGKKITEEHRRNLSLSHIGKPPGNKGVPKSEEAKRKISESKKGTPSWNKGIKTGRNEKQIAALTGRKRPQSDIDKNKKPVLQIDKSSGLVIKTWDSGKEAGNQLGINSGNIASCCASNLYKTVGGFIWKHA